jgi:hypothetical protein
VEGVYSLRKCSRKFSFKTSSRSLISSAQWGVGGMPCTGRIASGGVSPRLAYSTHRALLSYLMYSRNTS